MARLARVVVPGVVHHVTQRGNRRQQTFFQEDDYRAYLDLLGEWCGRCGVEVCGDRAASQARPQPQTAEEVSMMPPEFCQDTR
jgi:hypothetical protein